MQSPKIIDAKQLLLQLKSQRPLDANKGDFGHVLIMGGDYNMAGAVIMACEAAFRTGAGRVTVLTKQENFAALLTRLPNAMTACANNKQQMQEILQNKTVIAIGMGMGKTPWAHDMLEVALASNLPKIIDADALNLIAQIAQNKKLYNLQNSIITPHPQEAARLLNCQVSEIQQDRLKAVKNLYEKYGAITVLKGHDSLIATAPDKIALCPYGNPGMAVAGMGDVLSGIIAGFTAQNYPLADAAILGVTIHALAGDMAAKTQGQIGILPPELLQYVPQIINKF